MNTTHKLLRRRVLPVLGVGAALASGGGLAVDAASAAAQSVEAQQAVSQNWSGYSVTRWFRPPSRS